MNNIHIFYKHTDKNKINSGRPEWFNYEKCLANLIETIDPYRESISLNMWMDGEYNGNFVEKYDSTYNRLQVKFNHPIKTVLALYEHIKNNTVFDDNDLIYFLENDYLHLKSWPDKVYSLYKKYGQALSYVTLYDHNDKYTYSMYQNLKSQIIVTDDHHWRTVPSTTATFIVSVKTFLEDYDVWMKGQEDHATFLKLGQKNRVLVSPIPALSTHCQNNYLSPTIDWSQISSKTLIK